MESSFRLAAIQGSVNHLPGSLKFPDRKRLNVLESNSLKTHTRQTVDSKDLGGRGGGGNKSKEAFSRVTSCDSRAWNA